MMFASNTTVRTARLAFGLVLAAGLVSTVSGAQVGDLDKTALKALDLVDKAAPHFDAAKEALAAEDLKGARKEFAKARKLLDKVVELTGGERYQYLGEALLGGVRRSRRHLVQAEDRSRNKDAEDAGSHFREAHQEYLAVRDAVRTVRGS